MLVFVEGGKPENPEKNPRSKDENQQQTQPTYDVESGNRTRATLVGGECSHHCAIPARLIRLITIAEDKAGFHMIADRNEVCDRLRSYGNILLRRRSQTLLRSVIRDHMETSLKEKEN